MHWQICWVDLKCRYSNNFNWKKFSFLFEFTIKNVKSASFFQNHEIAPKLFVYLPLWAVNMFISIVKLTITIYIYILILHWINNWICQIDRINFVFNRFNCGFRKYIIKRRSNQQLVLLKQHLKYNSSQKVLLMRHWFMAVIQNGLLLQ